jgi:hypothetical protein
LLRSRTNCFRSAGGKEKEIKVNYVVEDRCSFSTLNLIPSPLREKDVPAFSGQDEG